MRVSKARPADNGNLIQGFYPFIYEGVNGAKLPCRIYIPEEIQAGYEYPLIVHLHGAGSRGNNNVLQISAGMGAIFAKKEMQNKHPCFILAPQCPEKWVDTEWTLLRHEQPPITIYMHNAIEAIKKVVLTYPVNKSRIYLTGQSMGGFAVWDILCREPNMFAGAIAICGGGDESKAPLIRDIPIRVFHGAIDDVVKVERSRNMVNALKKAGGHPIYTEYENVGHNSWVNAYKEKDLQDWLFANVK